MKSGDGATVSMLNPKIMKYLAVVLLLTSCASVKPTYDYQAEGKKGVNYKPTKPKVRYVKILVVAGFVGYFMAENYKKDD